MTSEEITGRLHSNRAASVNQVFEIAMVEHPEMRRVLLWVQYQLLLDLEWYDRAQVLGDKIQAEYGADPIQRLRTFEAQAR
jgi:hypothetical protein